MNDSPLDDVQRGLYVALTAAGLADGRVYDHVPEGAVWPYVVVGDVVGVPDNAHRQPGWAVDVAVHVWSHASGAKEAQQLLGEVVQLIDHRPDQVTVDGWTVVAIRTRRTMTMRDPDPDVRHGVVDLTITIGTDTPT